MPRFLSDVSMTQLAGEQGTWQRWSLVDDLIYERGEYRSGRLIVCPSGFITDGPTIPRFLWSIIPVWGSWGRAGIVHDYLCMQLAIGFPHEEAPTRAAADAVFYEAMAILGTGFLIRWAMYAGVRFGALIGVRTNSIDYNADLIGGA